MSPNLIEQPPAQEQEQPQDAAPEPPRLERDEPAGQVEQVEQVEQLEQAEPDHDDVQGHNGTSHRNGTPKARTNGHKASAEVWRVLLLSVDKIAPCPYQPRLMFDPVEMEELKESVRAHGVQQPILVRPAKAAATAAETNGDKRNVKTVAPLPYELVAGERRLRASKAAGRKHIPAIVRQMDDRTAAEIALTENVQRSNLSPVEEARGYKQLMLKFRMSEERIAKKVGKSVATIQSTMKLLALPSDVQDMLAKRQLTASHGHALLPLAAHEKVCLSVAQHALANHVTASALAQTPLPNIRELVQKKLVQELDFRTKFDFRSECPKCPFKAYVQSSYTSYCLKPPEWHKKQIAAMEHQKSEAAQAMQRVREEVSAQEEAGREARQVDVTHLPHGSYRDLSRVELPAGCCEACPCRREVAAPHDPNEPHELGQPEKKVPVCLDPERFKSLREAERKAHEDRRRRHYTHRWMQCVTVLQDEAERAEPCKAAVLLTALVLRNELYRGGQEEAAMLSRSVALNLGITLPWNELLEAHDDSLLLSLLEGTLHQDTGVDSERIHRKETDGERAVVSALSTETEQVPEASNSNPNELLLFASALLLAREAQQAVKWTESTPRLDFVLGPQGAQGELDVSDSSEVCDSLDVVEAQATPASTAALLDTEDEEWPDNETLENERMEDEPLDDDYPEE